MSTNFQVGQIVGFKCDVEQYGKITKIERTRFGGVKLTLTASSDEGFTGDYIGGRMTYVCDASEVWTED